MDGESVWLSFKAWVWAVNTEIRKPERNLVTATELDTVNSQEAVLDILDLIETLFGTAHLEQIVVIYKEIML